MPTPQNMFEVQFDNYEAHSTSNSARLRTAYPNSPITGPEKKTNKIDEFSREGVRSFYAEECLGGEFPSVSDFGESNYDYSEAPTIPGVVEDPTYNESEPGSKGSTIVESGKGPNVATINLENLSDVEVVDPSKDSTSSPPGSGVGSGLSPKQSSEKGASNNGLISYPDKGSSGFS